MQRLLVALAIVGVIAAVGCSSQPTPTDTTTRPQTMTTRPASRQPGATNNAMRSRSQYGRQALGRPGSGM